MESFGALTGADLDNFERGGRARGGGLALRILQQVETW